MFRKFTPRTWQTEAYDRWMSSGRRGIVSVVTGGGKTLFALWCLHRSNPRTTLIVVPTVALLEQWWEQSASFFGLQLDEIHILNGRNRPKAGTINIAVINTAAKLADSGALPEFFLIVDECHRAASEQFQKALQLPTNGTLGLSATPERQYDDGLDSILVPAIGPVVYSYDYNDAKRDGVIVPFDLCNVLFELEPERQQQYEKLTHQLARTAEERGFESEEAVMLMLRRARVSNLSMNRIRIAIKLVAAHQSNNILVFHEDIEACAIIDTLLRELGMRSSSYHSKLTSRRRTEVLQEFKSGSLDVLVTCRALDEGFDVPSADIGIIAASTATRRQRIQRLGRVLRPAPGKQRATVYTLIGTRSELVRMRQEEIDLDGVAEVSWRRI